jgi:hypothetical protein
MGKSILRLCYQALQLVCFGVLSHPPDTTEATDGLFQFFHEEGQEPFGQHFGAMRILAPRAIF